MKTFIYIIENKLNGDAYVGKSVNVQRRWVKHKEASRESDTHLYRAMRKYGIENFEIRTIDEHDDEEYALTILEPRWIKQLKEEGRNLYNMTEGGDGIVGHKHREETKAKIGEKNKNRECSDETREKIRQTLKGKPLREDIKEKVSNTLKGRSKPTRSEEHCKKLSEAAKQRGPMSEEHRAKIAESMKSSDAVGHPIDEETRKKISESLRGQVQSEATRAKRAESMRRAWEKRRLSNQSDQLETVLSHTEVGAGTT